MTTCMHWLLACQISREWQAAGCGDTALPVPTAVRGDGFEAYELRAVSIHALYVGCLPCIAGMIGSPGGSLRLSEENLLAVGAGGKRAVWLQRGDSLHSCAGAELYSWRVAR